GGGRSAGGLGGLAGSPTSQAGEAGEVSARPPLLGDSRAPHPDAAGHCSHSRPRLAGFGAVPGDSMGATDGSTAGIHPATGKTHLREGRQTTGLVHFPVTTPSRCGSCTPSVGLPENAARLLLLVVRP